MNMFSYFILQVALLAGPSQSVAWVPQKFEELSVKDTVAEHHLANPLQQKLCELVRGNDRIKDCDAYTSEIGTLRLKFIDLNSDGVPEIIVQAGDDEHCSPTSNCAFWILKKSANSYLVLLKRGNVQSFSVEPRKTNGYADLVTGVHGSATYSGLSLYQYDGRSYRLADCARSDYSYLGTDGEYHTTQEPKITRQPCGSHQH
jgi:hypothetical protein